MFAWLRVMSADTAATIPGRSLPCTMRQAWSREQVRAMGGHASDSAVSGRMPRPAAIADASHAAGAARGA